MSKVLSFIPFHGQEMECYAFYIMGKVVVQPKAAKPASLSPWAGQGRWHQRNRCEGFQGRLTSRNS